MTVLDGTGLLEATFRRKSANMTKACEPQGCREYVASVPVFTTTSTDNRRIPDDGHDDEHGAGVPSQLTDQTATATTHVLHPFSS